MRRKLAAGNWKMNGTSADLAQIEAIAQAHTGALSEIVMAPPTTLLHRASEFTKTGPVTLGAQDCDKHENGAHTGDISAEMLIDAGASYVILGHSERRADHAEHDEDVSAKAQIALKAGMRVIICLGEELEEREAENTLDVIAGQLARSIPADISGDRLVIAYEPIWAIGTGKVPSIEQIAEVHDFIRARLEERFGSRIARSVRLLYGGSVKPNNAAAIFAVDNVDGALVGGASLIADDFSPIINALDAS
ncbi:triose-phosphate isomerase [Planktotalea sp.]|uniref:triose-phosphate isomerase n=1 Tax=Planktotalea sp. TaxID=2029877 RepID=UPI0025D871D1|nr:triose-phosphate isomerase [Planktotalea sp.]